MDGSRFDALTRRLGMLQSRRTLLGGFAAAVAGAIGLRPASTGAAGVTTLTIHNATCGQRLTGDAIYAACHDHGFGCTEFSFRNRTIRTNARGRVTATIAAGTLTLAQQPRAVRQSRGIWVHCSAGKNRVLFSGNAANGAITIAVRKGEQVVCDWYNYASHPLRFPGQCGTPTTTPRPTTTTEAPIVCATDPDFDPTPCTTTADCSAIEGAICVASICLCPVGSRFNADATACLARGSTTPGAGSCVTGVDSTAGPCQLQMCHPTCSPYSSFPGACYFRNEGGFICGNNPGPQCTTDADCPVFAACARMWDSGTDQYFGQCVYDCDKGLDPFSE